MKVFVFFMTGLLLLAASPVVAATDDASATSPDDTLSEDSVKVCYVIYPKPSVWLADECYT